jgi:hypothetical protein
MCWTLHADCALRRVGVHADLLDADQLSYSRPHVGLEADACMFILARIYEGLGDARGVATPRASSERDRADARF